VKVVERIEVPATEGRAVRVVRGQVLRVTDVEGTQVADLFALVDRDEFLSASHTRALTDRLFPKPGESFFTNRRRAVLTLDTDDSPGIHDMLIAACDAERYELLGAQPHASCAENFLLAMTPFGLGDVTVPQSVNLFMRIPVGDNDRLGWAPALSKAGDAVTLRVELDCIVAVSACPQDIVPINGNRPTPVRLEVLGES
jgi:uncharacterized protein YcgI (DUF1989 family)